MLGDSTRGNLSTEVDHADQKMQNLIPFQSTLQLFNKSSFLDS